MDEIHILTRIKEQQQVVMESFAKHVKRAVMTRPGGLWDEGRGGGWEDQPTGRVVSERERRQMESARLTCTKADNLLKDVRERIFELNTLLENAANTSAAVRLSPGLWWPRRG